MNDKRRLNILLVLGLSFLALAIHNVASSRLGIIIERDSLSNVLKLFPGGVVGIVVAAAAVATALFFVFFSFGPWLENREGPSPPTRHRRRGGSLSGRWRPGVDRRIPCIPCLRSGQGR